MKILHVIADLERERGGPAQVCVEMAKLMAGRGHDVRIVTTDRGIPPEYLAVREETRGGHFAIESFPIDRPRFFGTSWALRQRLRNAIPEADVVHLHSLYLFHDLITGAYCRRFATPYIVQPHGSLDPYIYRHHRLRKSIVDFLFNNAVLADAAGLHYTMQEERTLARPYARNPRGWVVPIGIDLSSFNAPPSRDALRTRYPQIGDRRVVLFFGRLNFKKGLDVAIKTFAEVARDRDDIFLVIAGPDGGLRARAEQWVAEAGIGNRALFTGMVTGEDKGMVLGGSDVFILPSQSENFGISVIEAAASGMPVIISDRVNLWHDFREAQAGLTAPPTVAAFATHLRSVLDNPADTEAMARRGVALVRRRFSWEALGDQYEEMYREAAAWRSAKNLYPARDSDQTVAPVDTVAEPEQQK